MNGHRVTNQNFCKVEGHIQVEAEGFVGEYFINEKDIKSIVTKEQFKEMEYRVDE